MVEDDPARPRDRGARGAARRALRRARRAARASTPPATRRSRRRAASSCASSTTTSRSGRAGSTRCSPPPPSIPSTRRSAGRSGRGWRARNLHACGREPLPVTTLDLGPEDRDAEFVWGANMALRRERARAHRPVRRGARRRRRRGGLAAPPARRRRAHRLRRRGGRRPPPHGPRRADLRRSSRAAYFRGRASRRYDARKGVAPPLAAELRTLAGCLWHIVRRRCGVGDRRSPR